MKSVKSSPIIKWGIPDSLSSPRAPGHMLHLAAPDVWDKHVGWLAPIEPLVLEAVGYAVSHYMGGGYIDYLELLEDEEGLGISANYEFTTQCPKQASKLITRSIFAGLLFCELVGVPVDTKARRETFARATDQLKFSIARPAALKRGLEKSWRDALNTIAAPRAVRTAAALVHHLLRTGSIRGMPDVCYSRNDEPIPELDAAEARLLDDVARVRKDIAEAVGGMAERHAARVAERDRNRPAAPEQH